MSMFGWAGGSTPRSSNLYLPGISPWDLPVNHHLCPGHCRVLAALSIADAKVGLGLCDRGIHTPGT